MLFVEFSYGMFLISNYIIFSFKKVLRDITSNKENTLHFMKECCILLPSVNCPGLCINGKLMYSCGRPMELKKTNDNKDKYIQRCHKIHKVQINNTNYVTKDVKLTIRHNSWLVDAKLSLETILEMAYLWSQAFSLNEIIHELKISNRTAIEWFTVFRECCIS